MPLTHLFTPFIFALLALFSFAISYAATFILLALTKSSIARFAAATGLIIAFSLSYIMLFLTSGGTGLMVMMPAGCLGLFVADIRMKLRTAKLDRDIESTLGWSQTLRTLMLVMLPITLAMAMTAGIR